jgi:hypothetical protein
LGAITALAAGGHETPLSKPGTTLVGIRSSRSLRLDEPQSLFDHRIDLRRPARGHRTRDERDPSVTREGLSFLLSSSPGNRSAPWWMIRRR